MIARRPIRPIASVAGFDTPQPAGVPRRRQITVKRIPRCPRCAAQDRTTAASAAVTASAGTPRSMVTPPSGAGTIHCWSPATRFLSLCMRRRTVSTSASTSVAAKRRGGYRPPARRPPPRRGRAPRPGASPRAAPPLPPRHAATGTPPPRRRDRWCAEVEDRPSPASRSSACTTDALIATLRAMIAGSSGDRGRAAPRRSPRPARTGRCPLLVSTARSARA